MKKITVFLALLIILSNVPICSFAFEMTDGEYSAYSFASEFFDKYHSNIYLKTEYDLSDDTIAHFDESPQIKNEILEKAKEYEDEIRDNHYYRYHEDNAYIWETADADGDGVIEPSEQSKGNKRYPAKQFDSTAIEDVISSFPVFIEKKCRYRKALEPYDTNLLFNHSPKSVTVSESGFAYVNYGSCYVLLYRYITPDEDMWLVCDISIFYDEYDAKHRFHSEDFDVEKEIDEYFSRYKDTNTVTYTDTDPVNESDNKVQGSPKESKPTNYIPWIICAVETVAITALAITLVLKKKKK